MTLEAKLKELEVYEKALLTYYPNLTQFERLQVSVSLMGCNTKEEAQRYLTKL